MFKNIFLAMSFFLAISGCSEAPNVNVEVEDINNQAIALPSSEGKWVVVNYWADWCPPCREEIGELNAFFKNYQDRVTVVGVNADRLSIEKLQQVANTLDIQYPILKTDPINIIDTALEGLPSTYLVSPKGRVYGPILGAVTEEELLDQMHAYS